LSSPILNGWKQIAEFLQVHESTAMQWEKDRNLPVKRVGKVVITTTVLLMQWLEKEKAE
jgi:hypothetical protein